MNEDANKSKVENAYKFKFTDVRVFEMEWTVYNSKAGAALKLINKKTYIL